MTDMAPGERALGGDLDGLVLLLASGRKKQAERRDRRREQGKGFTHWLASWKWMWIGDRRGWSRRRR